MLLLHAQFRNNCNHLNEDLYLNHLIWDQVSDCNNGVENAAHNFFQYHFFFRCCQWRFKLRLKNKRSAQ